MKKKNTKQGMRRMAPPMGMEVEIDPVEEGREKAMMMSDAQMRKLMAQTTMGGEKKKKRAR